MQILVFIKGSSLSVYLKHLPDFLKAYQKIKNQARKNRADFPFGKIYPCLEDAENESGIAAGHYFHQDLLVAGLIFKNNPVKHVDIGSRIDGFVAHVASFREVEVLDIRELSHTIPHIHFRLGRYGDEINYDGHLIGWENIYRMLKKDGKLYFSVPIGSQ